MKKENKSLRDRLENENERYKAFVALNQQTTEQFRADMESEHKAHMETREALVRWCFTDDTHLQIKANYNEQSLTKDLATVRAQLAASEQRLAVMLSGDDGSPQV